MPITCSADVQTSGNSLPAIVADPQAGDELFLRQRALGEERLHQLLVGFGDHLDQLLARLLRAIGERRRECPLR